MPEEPRGARGSATGQPLMMESSGREGELTPDLGGRKERRRKQPENMAVGEYTEGLPFCVQNSYLERMKMLNNYIGHRFENPNLMARRNLETKQQCNIRGLHLEAPWWLHQLSI